MFCKKVPYNLNNVGLLVGSLKRAATVKKNIFLKVCVCIKRNIYSIQKHMKFEKLCFITDVESKHISLFFYSIHNKCQTNQINSVMK